MTSLFYPCLLNCFSKCEMVLKIKHFLLPKFSELTFENHQEGFVKHFHIYAALRFIFPFLAVLAFTGREFRDCWDGLMGNSHPVVCLPAGGRAVLIWKENKWMEPWETHTGHPDAVPAGRQERLLWGRRGQNTPGQRGKEG